jgi:disulfide bond formation protein DsbB
MQRPRQLRIIFRQSLIAMSGSLYYGRYGDPVQNILSWELFNSANGFVPCDLCRYARILMYPIVLLSFIALMRDDRGVIKYIIPMSFLWILLSGYHYLLQKFDIPTLELCTLNNPCNALGVDYFGFLTIPLLCVIAQIVILTMSILLSKKTK